MTDGYPGYNEIGCLPGVSHAGCWAHVRRPFFELTKSSGKIKIANIALGLIRKLYAIEKEAKENELDKSELLKLRQEKSKPVVDELKRFLDEKESTVNPKGYLGKAVKYAQNQWPKFILFLNDPNISLDNNLLENDIRPFIVGRKGWLFSGIPKGARASAGFYSLIQTAIANGHEPYWYMRYLFDNILHAKTDEDIKALFPMNVSKETLNEYREKSMQFSL